MASESQLWWSTQYTKHSIRDLQALPIFAKFNAQRFPYARDSGKGVETFTMESAGATLEWSHKTKAEGEKFSHERSSDTWFYEKRSEEGEVAVTRRTWLSPDTEWGTIQQQYRDFQVHEEWRLRDTDRRYEKYTLEEGSKRGLRTGSTPVVEGMESWVEAYWEAGEDTEFEKVWTRPDASGGENKHQRGAYWWGEVWHKAGDSVEKKSWHTEGDRDWGHVVGEACGKSWHEKWDISKTKRSEERLAQEGERHHGFRYLRDGADWYRQEWDGLAILGIDEGAELLKKMEFVQQLDEVHVNAMDTLLRGEHSMELLLREVQSFDSEFRNLQQLRLALSKPDSNNPDALFASIREARELADQQEQLKQRMIDAAYAEKGKYCQFPALFDRLLKASMATYKTLAAALKREKEVGERVDQWTKTYEEQKRRKGLSNFDKDAMIYDDLLGMEREKNDYLAKFVGGLSQADTKQAMEQLYNIMVKHDAVSDKIIDLVQDAELKETLDGFEAKFEAINQEYRVKQDPEKLQEVLGLLLDYQPIHLHLVGRLRGYEKAEMTSELASLKGLVDESRGTASLENLRSKVRSGRSTKASPFQLVDRDLNRLLPFMLQLDKWLHAHLDTTQTALMDSLSACLKKNVDGGEPFEIIIEKAALLAEVAAALEQQASGAEETLMLQDVKLDRMLGNISQTLKEDTDLATSKDLLSQHYAEQDIQLLASKLSLVDTAVSSLPQMAAQLSAQAADLQDQEKIISMKGSEIADLTQRLGAKELYAKQLEADLLAREGDVERETEPLKARIMELEREWEARVKALEEELRKMKEGKDNPPHK